MNTNADQPEKKLTPIHQLLKFMGIDPNGEIGINYLEKEETFAKEVWEAGADYGYPFSTPAPPDFETFISTYNTEVQ